MPRNFHKLFAVRVLHPALLVAIVASPLITIAPASSAAQSLADKLKALTQRPNSQTAQAKPGQAAAKPGQAAAAGGAGTNNTGPFTAPAGTKIEPTLMAPFQQGSQFQVSPHGIHVASAQLSGSRKVLVYDGVAGPKFDALFGQDGENPVLFSPDNNHWAYCGQQGTEWVVMRDGVELMRGPGGANGAVNIQNCQLGFSANSQHLYFTSQQIASDNSVSFKFVWDGKASVAGAPPDMRLYAFSPDSNHFAYIWNNPDPRIQQQHLYIDNKQAPYDSGFMQWSGDSQHLYSVLHVAIPGSRTGGAYDALLDGKPFLRADGVQLFVAPVGNMAAAAVFKNGPTTATTSNFLVIGGKQIPGSESPSTISNMVFSPDGKHYASIYRNQTQTWVFSDGQKGRPTKVLAAWLRSKRLLPILRTQPRWCTPQTWAARSS